LELFPFKFKREGPLAARMAPRSLDEFVGQEHILGEGKPLRRLILEDRLLSAIFFGPPGTGKTALAIIIAEKTESPFISLNAAEAKPSDLKRLIREADDFNKRYGKRPVLFLDEIHRFNRLQQELLLPQVERGIFTFLGSTVQNPFFAISKALLSRTLIFEFKPLRDEDIIRILKRALEDRERGLGSYEVEVETGVLERIASLSDGDARRALNTLELLFLSAGGGEGVKITKRFLEETLGVRHLRFERGGDEHYDLISALIKSIRGSDPDAALYWCVRLLESGEDPRYILRRILVHSAEDIGLADPQALVVASAALNAFEMVGRPEGDLIIAEAVLYLSTAPKSNTVLRALNAAKKIVKEERAEEVPDHLRDSHYKGAKKIGRGVGYIYPHERSDEGQLYLPEALLGKRIFEPRPVGYEKEILRRLIKKRREVEKK
jgi:putative ATPase